MTPPLPRTFVVSPPLQPEATEALLAAASVGDAQGARRLLEQGADPDATDPHGFAPIHLACYYGHAEVVEALLDFDADMGSSSTASPSGGPDPRDGEGKIGSALTPLIIAAASGHRPIVEALLRRGAVAALPAAGGVTALIAAASLGHLEVVQCLILAGAPLDVARFDGATALALAAASGHLEVVRMLHGSGADIDPPCCPSIVQRVALAGYPQVLRYLLWNGAEHGGYDAAGHTALGLAAAAGHAAVVQQLLEFGVAPDDLPARDGATALHCAARGGHLRTVKLLVAQRADLQRPDASGALPLHAAVVGGNVEVVKYLLSLALVAAATPEASPRAAAVRSVLRVVSLGAGDADEQHETTLLHVACHHGHLPIVRLLLSLKVDVDAADSLGCTALRVACDEGHAAVAELLLRLGADVDRADDSRVSPLISAAHYGRLDLVRLLVVAGCDTRHTDDQGLSALHHAALKGHLPVVKFLTSPQHASADDLPETRASSPSPRALAAMSGHSDVVNFLAAGPDR